MSFATRLETQAGASESRHNILTDGHFLLTPGWRALVDHPLMEIAAHQWRVANETILADLAVLPPADWLFVRYTDLIAAPKPTIRRIAHFFKS